MSLWDGDLGGCVAGGETRCKDCCRFPDEIFREFWEDLPLSSQPFWVAVHGHSSEAMGTHWDGKTEMNETWG